MTPYLILLVVALSTCGCRSAQQSQHTQTDSGFTRGTNAEPGHEDNYSRTYETESRRHRHRGHGRDESGSRDDAATDSWSRYDRSDQGDGGQSAAGSSASGSSASGSSASGSVERRSTAHHNSHAITSAPGAFDFYLLNLSWSPEFCHGHPDAAECSQHRAFTLHGLWPQNSDGTYPEDCGDAPGPGSPTQYADIYPDASLLHHEWQTHGTCSALGADAFFAMARHAEQQTHIPTELAHMTQGTSLSPTQIVTLFRQSNPGLPAGSIAISCGNNYLTAVEICLDKTLKPVSCQSVKTCGANQVRIAAPQ